MYKRVGHITEDTMVGLKSDLNRISYVKYRNTNRKVAHLGCDYSFSGITVKDQDLANYPHISDLMGNINAKLGTQFNAVLINWYPKGLSSSIGFHTDAEACLVHGSEVLSISIGESCVFLVKELKTGSISKITLSDGDVFLMDKFFQQNYLHSVERQIFNTSRVSLTFRVFK